MNDQLLNAVCFTVLLTLLIALIRLVREDIKFGHLVNLRVFLYVLILLVGNVATTFAAERLITKSFADQSGPTWFWISFIGVFGFEAIVKNINITIFKTGVLTISDWINDAQESAITAMKEKKQIHDEDSEVIIAKPGQDFRYKIIMLELTVDIEKQDTAVITEYQKLKCCDHQLNEISTIIKSDGEIIKFTDSAGTVTNINKGKYRTIFPPKKKNDTFERTLTYQMRNSFTADNETWSIEFDTPTKEYRLTIVLPADKIVEEIKLSRILHLTDEVDQRNHLTIGVDKDERTRIFVLINDLNYKEKFRLSWHWRPNRL